MNIKISEFINNHEDEINTDDFFSLFVAAHSELSNIDCANLVNDLAEVFNIDMLAKQREAAFRFILTMSAEDLDSSHTFRSFINNFLHDNILGYAYNDACEYIRANAEEFDLLIWTVPGSSIERISKSELK